MFALHRLAPQLARPFSGQRELAVVLAVSGIALALAGVLSFRRTQTTVDPRYPERVNALVTAGVYRVSRNPMYLGMLLCLAALAVWLGNLLAVLILPLFVAYLSRFQIEPEERAIRTRFGDEYVDYCSRVRRWL
jgi:protein-S-isoprenylcysteine O-methyltransferase Ste14